MDQLPGRGGAPPVGPKDQLFPFFNFEGSPNQTVRPDSKHLACLHDCDIRNRSSVVSHFYRGDEKVNADSFFGFMLVVLHNQLLLDLTQ